MMIADYESVESEKQVTDEYHWLNNLWDFNVVVFECLREYAMFETCY
jgi:hypothetical protein